MNFSLRLLFCFSVSALGAVCFLVPVKAQASVSDGIIVSGFSTARVCHDTLCSSGGTPGITPGMINFRPTVTNPSDVLHITDSGFTGKIWGNELGWITLNPTGEGVMIDPTTGLVLGRAWSQVAGWINFAPTGQAVYINSNGEFTGFAWAGGTSGGWIQFNCGISGACVKTDWRILSLRTTTPTPTPSSGGGVAFVPTTGAITLSGASFVNAHVYLLQNGVRVNDLMTANGNFSFTVSNLVPGNYFFTMYATDTNGIQSSHITLPVSVTTGASGVVAKIVLPPTLQISRTQVTQGGYITVSGFGMPNSEVTIVRSDTNEPLFVVHTDTTGKYTVAVDTSTLKTGTIPLVSQAISSGTEIFSSIPVALKVLQKFFPSFLLPTKEVSCAQLKGDLNGDCRVNIVDVTIVHEWQHRPITKRIREREFERLNGDGVIDMRDFSIIVAHWTG